MLKLNSRDIKSVQGDSGHAQAKMVTDQYSHILDSDRKANARLFEKQFYGAAGEDPPAPAVGKSSAQTSDTELLLKALSNPETKSLLMALLNAVGIDNN